VEGEAERADCFIPKPLKEIDLSSFVRFPPDLGFTIDNLHSVTIICTTELYLGITSVQV